MRKPRDLKLNNFFQFRAANKGQKLMYLYDRQGGHYWWLTSIRKMKAMRSWLNKAIKYAEQKDRADGK